MVVRNRYHYLHWYNVIGRCNTLNSNRVVNASGLNVSRVFIYRSTLWRLGSVTCRQNRNHLSTDILGVSTTIEKGPLSTLRRKQNLWLDFLASYRVYNTSVGFPVHTMVIEVLNAISLFVTRIMISLKIMFRFMKSSYGRQQSRHN